MFSYINKLAIAGVVTLCASTVCLAGYCDPACRSGNLQSDINQAASSGTLSAEEATKLRSDAAHIAADEQNLRNKDNGQLSASDEGNIDKRCQKVEKSMHKLEAMRPDNTGRNVRDERKDSPTPQTQSESKGDLAVTQNVRRRLIHDKGLSTYGKNVKIITNGGTVTLRGPVHSAEERSRIEAAANECAGGYKVINEIEVK